MQMHGFAFAGSLVLLSAVAGRFLDSSAVPGRHTVQLNGQNFTLPDGFAIEQVAGPPLVERPITAAFDELGRLYVSESSGTNDPVQKQLKETPHRIIRLE